MPAILITPAYPNWPLVWKIDFKNGTMLFWAFLKPKELTQEPPIKLGSGSEASKILCQIHGSSKKHASPYEKDWEKNLGFTYPKMAMMNIVITKNKIDS